MVVEHAGSSWVRQDVRVAHADRVGRERPVVKGGAGIVVLNECHGAARPEPDEPRRAPLRVSEPPELVPRHCLLQDSLGGEVERRGGAARLVAPVDGALAVPVLVVVEHPVCVVACVPELAERHAGHGGVNVLAGVVARVPLDEVEAPPVESLGPHPLHPRLEVLADKCLRVVDVGRSRVVLPAVRLPAPAVLGVVAADGVGAPVEPPPKGVPPPPVVL
mmetsp:Transcript_26918/g.86477  ORF Transcript_26918/g.86477 Transcript_26918/m.86477 type:complete len:219 (+) Transcript_26918:350-1006(+)